MIWFRFGESAHQEPEEFAEKKRITRDRAVEDVFEDPSKKTLGLFLIFASLERQTYRRELCLAGCPFRFARLFGCIGPYLSRIISKSDWGAERA